MKLIPLFYSVTLVFMMNGCATFEDVTFDKQADLQLNKLASTSIKFESDTQMLALTNLFTITEVDKLIANALANNPNLQHTLLTLKKAKQKLTSTSADQWPGISVNVNSNKAEDTSALYTGSLDIAWTLDIWQQLANASDAERANLNATAYAYQGAKDLLVANVMQAYLNLIQLTQLIEIETNRVATYKTNEDVIVARYRKGLISLNELDTANSNTQSSQATLVDYQSQYQQAKRNLSLLTGLKKNQISYSTQFPAVVMPLHEMNAHNMGRRPDLQQAYQNIISSQYQHKVAYKALLPGLSLSGSLNNTGGNLHDALFGSSAWQLLAKLSAPIFNADKLTSEAQIAKLSAEQSYWLFQETLLTAVNEVDNAVAEEAAITKRLSLIKSALASAKRSEETYTARYRQGTASFIDLLQVQQQTFSLQTQVTQLTYQRLNNRISLGLALGLGV